MMGSEQRPSSSGAAPTMVQPKPDQPKPIAHAAASQPQPPPPKSVPAAPETVADPHAAHDAAAPLKPAQRGLAWLCELLRSQHEE